MYVKLETCPCGRCTTSWGRGHCYWDVVKAFTHRAVWSNKPTPPANYAEIEAIAALWRHRADDDDGYAREDEIEWYLAALKRAPTEAELAKWGRAPIDWSQVSTDEMTEIIANGEAGNACSVRAARRAGEALAARLEALNAGNATKEET